MKEKLAQIKAEAIKQIENSRTLEQLNEVRVSQLGKKGALTEILKGMKDVAPEDRPKVGQLVNETRAEIEKVLEDSRKKMEELVREAKMQKETIDVTLPAKKAKVGHVHPNFNVLDEVERIFIGMGYEVVEGPEVERDYYNFEALNIPADHPAKDEQDTFYINGDLLLRTQTSSTQVHEMETGKMPIRMIAPGRVFRADEVDATHSPSFHQIEGLVIDKGVTMADLKGTLNAVMEELYGKGTVTRFRPHHFPFTEPSFEVDFMSSDIGRLSGKWIEIMGCGMVDPNVLDNVGLVPKIYSGYAFGLGVERVAMLMHSIDDIRHFYTNDVRFLRQFRSR